MTLQKSPVTALTLKWIAILIMAVDHTGVVCYKWLGWSRSYLLLRFIGRNAFPIFALLLIEGFRRTRNRWRYLRNLLIFSVISEIPFDLAVMGGRNPIEGQNIFWTLSLGLLSLMTIEEIRRSRLPFAAKFVCVPISAAAFMVLGECLRADYGNWGVLLIVLMYAGEELPFASTPQNGDASAISNDAKAQFVRNCGAVAGAVLWMTFYDFSHGWINELYGAFSAIPILLYNGQRGRYRLSKWFFYGFYPAHLLILYALQDTLFQWALT